MLHSIVTVMGPKKFVTTSEPPLLSAYVAAHYKVTGTTIPFVLRIGQRCPELASVHLANGVSRSAFITAWNPRSVATSERINRASQKRLETQLTGMGLRLLAGIGEDPSGAWPGEPGVLVLGISRGEAERIGQTFGQLAIVWSGESAVPELVVMPASPQGPGR
jgi:hypothetical protein